MKWIEKTILILYSFIMLIFAILSSLLIFGWIEPNTVTNLIRTVLNNPVYSNIFIVINIIFILLSIRTIFFSSESKKERDNKEGILLQNDDGELIISKATIENLVSIVLNGFDSIESAVIRVDVEKQNTVSIFVNLVVKENVIIKELSNNIQTRIKQKIKKTSDLEVERVNVRVKEIKEQEKLVIRENSYGWF